MFLEALFLTIRDETIKFASYRKKKTSEIESKLIIDIENLERLIAQNSSHMDLLSEKKAELKNPKNTR